VGKSTLLNLIAGLDRPDGGRLSSMASITPAGEDALTRLRRDKLGFVFQAFHVLPHLTVRQNVALPLWLQGLHGSAADLPAQQLLDAVGLGDRAASWPRELSGGEMQRVAIARALVHRPRLVLADEPTGNLDPANGARVLALLAERIRQAGAIGILVTHSLEAAATADRVLRLTTGGLRVRLAPVFLGSLARRRMATLFSLIAIVLGVALGHGRQAVHEAALSEFGRGLRSLAGDADFAGGRPARRL
jgi:putative ABC transport system ATP-binding protein